MRVPGIPFVQGRNDYPDGDGRKYGMAIHNTSNDATDAQEASYATRRSDGVSSHFYVDADSITQSLDTEARAGHAGSRVGNENSVAFEITGSNGMSRQWWLDNVAWQKLGYAAAYLITHDPDYEGFEVRRASVAEMRANPRVKAFYGHNDMRLAWGGTDHVDPGDNFPWDRLFEAVNAALHGKDTFMDGLKPSEQVHLYRMVRNLESQFGAFLAGAEQRPVFADQTTGYTYPAVPIVPNRRLREIAGADDADEAEIADRVTAALTPIVERIDDDVLAGLGARSPSQIAQLLRGMLNPQDAAEVAALLTAPQES